MQIRDEKTLKESLTLLETMADMPEIYAKNLPDECGCDKSVLLTYITKAVARSAQFLMNFGADKKIPAYQYEILSWQYLGVSDVLNQSVNAFTNGAVPDIAYGIEVLFGEDSSEYQMYTDAFNLANAMKNIVSQTKDANIVVDINFG